VVLTGKDVLKGIISVILATCWQRWECPPSIRLPLHTGRDYRCFRLYDPGVSERACFAIAEVIRYPRGT
jgi:hypothetical protein